MAKTVEERVQEIMENMKHIGEIRIMKNGERVKCIDLQKRRRFASAFFSVIFSIVFHIHSTLRRNGGIEK